MPTYDYQCNKCNTHFERVLPVSECDSVQSCPVCGRRANKIIVHGYGGIVRTGDRVQWVVDASKVLCNGTNDKLETIQDYRNFLARNPNVVPAESHPCIPSSRGDSIYKKRNEKQEKKERSKRAHKHLRKLRSITLNSRTSQSAPQERI